MYCKFLQKIVILYFYLFSFLQFSFLIFLIFLIFFLGHCLGANLYMKPIIALIPLTWRFMQCIRRYHDLKDKHQLWNAGKYASSIFVSIFSALRTKDNNFTYVWIVFVIISTISSYVWDIRQDWKIHVISLRDVLLYPYQVRNKNLLENV